MMVLIVWLVGPTRQVEGYIVPMIHTIHKTPTTKSPLQKVSTTSLQWFIPSRWGGSPDERHPSNHCGLEISESQNSGPVKVTIPSTLQENHRLKSVFFLGICSCSSLEGLLLAKTFFLWNSFFVFFRFVVVRRKQDLIAPWNHQENREPSFFLVLRSTFSEKNTHRKRSSFDAWLQPFCCLWLTTAWCFSGGGDDAFIGGCDASCMGWGMGVVYPVWLGWHSPWNGGKVTSPEDSQGFGSWWSSHFVSVFLCEIELGFSWVSKRIIETVFSSHVVRRNRIKSWKIESIQSSRVYRINLIANLAAPIDDMLTLMMWKETTCQSPTISDRAYHNIYCHRFWLFWRPFFRIQQKSLQTFELTERFRWYHLNGMNILSSFANRKTLFQKCLKFVFLPYRVTF